ncbi:MAG: asparaginase [Gemmatimonadetes bacterium]|nr:asparaginase [Gemmatimonadota bacterium]
MIHLLFTGGTISMQRDARAGGNVPAHDGAALVALAPELPAVAPFTVEDWGRYPACHMGPDTLWALRSRVAAVQRGGAARGIVVTHGTDTLEETAYLLGRTLDPAVPVVLTGAMRTSSEAGWDGPRNLTDAARVAADPASRGRGAMVVFAGKIFDGRTVAKVQATALDAFAAPHGAPIGVVAEGRVTFHAAAGPRTPLAPAGLSARVALVPLTLGDDGAVLDLLRPTHDGVVLGAFGSGNLPPGALPAIERWIGEGKPVVLGSRCLFGEVSPAYAFPGGGATVVRLGAVPAGPRTLAQARLELALALSAGVPYGAGA